MVTILFGLIMQRWVLHFLLKYQAVTLLSTVCMPALKTLLNTFSTQCPFPRLFLLFCP